MSTIPYVIEQTSRGERSYDIFAQAVRAGYGGYKGSEGYGEYSKFDEVKRWDYELYLEALRDLCWR